MSTESTYSVEIPDGTTVCAEIPAGATFLRVEKTNGVLRAVVGIPMKAAPPPSFEAVVASYRRRLEEMQWPNGVVGSAAQRAEEDRKNREASAAVSALNRIMPMVDTLDKHRPLAFTLWPESVIYGMDLGAADESVEGIAAQPQDDVVDAEFDPGAVQQDRPNPERPNPITAEWFKASVGTDPINDCLDRCNCNLAGALGHLYCGWDDARDMPKFIGGMTRRPEALHARIAVLEGLLHQAKGFLPINSGMLADIEAALA